MGDRGFEVVLVVKNSPANVGDIRDMGSICRSERCPGGGPANPLQYSCWRILWTEEPGQLRSQGWKESDMTEETYLAHNG